MLRANYHTHTNFCDGNNTAEEMVQAALDLGFEHLGFSGHMDPGITMDWDAYSSEIERMKTLYGDKLDILRGVELDTVFDPSTCSDAEYIVGSTHFIPVAEGELLCVDHEEEILVDGCNTYFGGDWTALSRAYYETEAHVFDNTHCTFVGHFDLVTRFNDSLHTIDETSSTYLTPALECIEHLANQGCAFEINCGAINRGRKAEPYPRPELLQALHDFGAEIFINADAHDAHLINGGFDVAIQKAIACGFTHVNILAHNEFGKVEVQQVALDTL